MERQSANAVLLVRPAAFGFNAEAAESNVFSHASTDPDFPALAAREFEALADRLDRADIDVLVLDDSARPPKPDAVFPNNWFSTHAEGALVLYPMATAARRPERRSEELRSLLERHGFEITRTIDLSGHEKEGRYLEGTGSLVLDRPRRRAYAVPGLRTDTAVLHEFGERLGYSVYAFDARDPGGRAIYHTNVVLALGTGFAALCSEAVAPDQRDALIADVEEGGREIIDISFAQLRRFGCNLLELRSRKDAPVIALSAKGLSSLKAEQIRKLEQFGRLVDVEVPTIEAVGGGSVRCMIAEVHLPRR